MTELVRSGPHDEPGVGGLRARVADLEHALAARAGEMARVESELTAFKIRYRHDVGRLHEELDELERAIAEAELGEIARRLQGETAATGAPSIPSDPLPRYTSDAVRTLFREVARAVHPDLARGDHTVERRHALMIEANRAYAAGDEERLRWILRAWLGSPEAVRGSGEEATRERLARRAAQIEEQLAAFDRALADLKASPLWTLKAMVDEAAARGKDLVGDMVRRLNRDILAARNRLDAMRGPRTG